MTHEIAQTILAQVRTLAAQYTTQGVDRMLIRQTVYAGLLRANAQFAGRDPGAEVAWVAQVEDLARDCDPEGGPWWHEGIARPQRLKRRNFPWQCPTVTGE
jgi:hypothetical protein